MSGPATVATLLAEARQAGLARLDASVLLAELLGVPRSWLLAHDDEAVTPQHAERLRAGVRRRAAGEPLAYLLGHKEFHGLRLGVSPAVLVPRPETETLVDWALDLHDATPRRVIDLGTGSGAIALALKAARPDWAVDAVDASPAALAQAQANGAALGLEVHWHLGDWWDAPLTGGPRFGLAVANPPYVAAGDPHLAALAYEPQSALVAGVDGLDALRRLVAGAPEHLQPGAWLLLEHGHDQARAVAALLQARGFVDVQTRLDLAGVARVTAGRRPA